MSRQATQLEISAALPIRTWEAIRKKITKLRGRGIIVPETGHLENDQTIYDYLEQHPEAAAAMPFSILMNSSRVIQNQPPSLQLRRFNLALLEPIPYSLFDEGSALKGKSTSSHSAVTSKPHDSVRSVGVPKIQSGEQDNDKA